MRLKLAAISYLLAAVCTAVFYWQITASLQAPYTSFLYGGGPTSQVLTAIPSLFGMVLFPYLGAAALLPSGSVWANAYRLLNGHISFPFIGGAALLYGGVLSSWYTVFGYCLFVLAASVLVAMAHRTPRPATAEQPPPAAPQP